VDTSHIQTRLDGEMLTVIVPKKQRPRSRCNSMVTNAAKITKPTNDKNTATTSV
jgi:hypothetical protein